MRPHLLRQSDPLAEVNAVTVPVRILSRSISIDLPEVDNGAVCLSSLCGPCLGLRLRRGVMQNVVDYLQVGKPLHLQLI